MAIDHNHLNLHANHLWADYHNHALPSGTVAYESVLRQCQLDGSLLSLQRIDAMLTHLRQELIKTFTQAQKSVNTAGSTMATPTHMVRSASADDPSGAITQCSKSDGSRLGACVGGAIC